MTANVVYGHNLREKEIDMISFLTLLLTFYIVLQINVYINYKAKAKLFLQIKLSE